MDREPEKNSSEAPAVISPDEADSVGKPSAGEEPVHRRFRLKSLGGLILIGVAAALVIGGVVGYLYAARYESTDDARIDGHIDPVSARVTGQIKKIRVNNGQFVKAGTLLIEIDPADYREAYEHAKAVYEQDLANENAARLQVQVIRTRAADKIAEARAGLKVARSNISASQQDDLVAQAEERSAKARDILAEKNLERAEKLVAKNAISRQSYDQTRTAAQSATASLAAAGDKVAAAAKKVAQARAQFDQARAALMDALSGPDQVKIAEAKAKSSAAAVETASTALAQAQLNLQYTRITAPADGIIGNKGAQIGENVSPGQVLLDLVQTNDVWVTADFKENQLRHMRPGQRADIHVDAYDKDYKGRVQSIGGATGEQFSLFPPENATGNYVKVVQRIPVRIVLNKGENRRHRLRPGMSVEPKVWIN
jgi:membrane fusion protein, multidrug efflux system